MVRLLFFKITQFVGVDTLPFGGIGHSGLGAYRGKYGYLEFSHAKSVLIRGFFGDKLARYEQKVASNNNFSARYPPMTDKSYKQLTYLLARRTIPKIFSWLRPSIPSLIIGVLIGVYLQRRRLL